MDPIVIVALIEGFTTIALQIPALRAELNKQVAAGTLTPEQASALIARVDAAMAKIPDWV